MEEFQAILLDASNSQCAGFETPGPIEITSNAVLPQILQCLLHIRLIFTSNTCCTVSFISASITFATTHVGADPESLPERLQRTSLLLSHLVQGST